MASFPLPSIKQRPTPHPQALAAERLELHARMRRSTADYEQEMKVRHLRVA